MDDLRVDPKSQRVSAYPKRFNAIWRNQIDQSFRVIPPQLAEAWTTRNAAFQAKWLNKICKLYQASSTKLIFFVVPHTPMTTPTQFVVPDAPDLRTLLPRRPGIMLLPPDAFHTVEQPHYFQDMDHVNNYGRRLFSHLFGQALANLSARPGAAKATISGRDG